MQKRVMIGLFAVLLLFISIIPVCIADNEIGIEITPVKNRITNGDWAVFDVDITNHVDNEDIFILSIKEEGVEWSVITESAVDFTTGMTINAGKTVRTRLLLKDKGLMPNPTKPYSVELSVKSLKGNARMSTLMYIYLLPEDYVPFESDINVSYNIPRYIDPRNIYSFKVALYNNNNKDIKNLRINIDSALVKKDANVQLEPQNRKAVEFTLVFDPDTKPMLDTLTINVTEGAKLLYRTTVPMEIVGYRMPFDQQTSTEKFFLRYLTTITLSNKDNVDEQQKFMVDHRMTDLLFTKTVPAAAVEDKDGKRYYAWDIKLASGESTSITIETDYKPVFYALIILIVLIFVYIYFRDPITIIKVCDEIKTEHGGIKEMKIILSLRNRKDEKLKGIRLVDMIPKLASVEKKEEGVGTIHPNRIFNTADGVALEWKFDMEPKEERIISYYIKSKLSILGGFKLPKSIAVVERGNSKVKVRSNNLNVTEK